MSNYVLGENAAFQVKKLIDESGEADYVGRGNGSSQQVAFVRVTGPSPDGHPLVTQGIVRVFKSSDLSWVEFGNCYLISAGGCKLNTNDIYLGVRYDTWSPISDTDETQRMPVFMGALMVCPGSVPNVIGSQGSSGTGCTINSTNCVPYVSDVQCINGQLIVYVSYLAGGAGTVTSYGPYCLGCPS